MGCSRVLRRCEIPHHGALSLKGFVFLFFVFTASRKYCLSFFSPGFWMILLVSGCLSKVSYLPFRCHCVVFQKTTCHYRQQRFEQFGVESVFCMRRFFRFVCSRRQRVHARGVTPTAKPVHALVLFISTRCDWIKRIIQGLLPAESWLHITWLLQEEVRILFYFRGLLHQ